jgi:hypothetical protein
MLERTAAELILATEAVADEEFRIPTIGMSYSPVIVTTAELSVCHYNPSDISLDTGEISNASFEIVPYVRFRKSLVQGGAQGETLTKIASESERTVFVVNANKFISFLQEWEGL